MIFMYAMVKTLLLFLKHSFRGQTKTRNRISGLKYILFDSNIDYIEISKFSQGQNERGQLGMMSFNFF